MKENKYNLKITTSRQEMAQATHEKSRKLRLNSNQRRKFKQDANFARKVIHSQHIVDQWYAAMDQLNWTHPLPDPVQSPSASPIVSPMQPAPLLHHCSVLSQFDVFVAAEQIRRMHATTDAAEILESLALKR